MEAYRDLQWDDDTIVNKALLELNEVLGVFDGALPVLVIYVKVFSYWTM